MSEWMPRQRVFVREHWMFVFWGRLTTTGAWLLLAIPLLEEKTNG